MKTTKKNPAAVALGRVRSKRKAAASRRNGALGGRPRTCLPDLPHEGNGCGGVFPWARTRGKKTAVACDTCGALQSRHDGWAQFYRSPAGKAAE